MAFLPLHRAVEAIFVIMVRMGLARVYVWKFLLYSCTQLWRIELQTERVIALARTKLSLMN